jgi:Bacterial membrane protein YfhO
MHHRWSIILVLGCLTALLLACYIPVLFQGQQFGFRDAAHYYYPLYERVQQEWNAGRIPLWEIEENAGMPLMGNPTAAVLYPLKIIYGLLPYEWGARLYVVVHTIVAFATMLVLMRSWGTSWTGSGISALAYAFGAPVLFQCCNVIFLVGAAWLPLGIHAVDRWVRCGRRSALIELAVVLALQVLGGEPQSAYLTGLAGVGYAAGVAWDRAASRRRADRLQRGLESRTVPGWLWAVLAAWLWIIWCAGVLVLGSWVPQFREHALPAKPLPWMSYVPMTVGTVWGIGGITFLVYWLVIYRRRQGWRLPLGLAWTGLAAGAALAAALSAAQLLPMTEFTQRTVRAAEAGTHDIYPFSLEPIRLAGLIWPDVLGNAFDGNTAWSEQLVRMPGAMPRLWVPSLYLGGLTLVLALGTLALRRSAPWRIWISVIAIISAVASLGQYTSPIWITRALAEGNRSRSSKPLDHDPGPRELMVDEAALWPPLRPLIRRLGPLEPEDTTPVRQDDFLRDGDGSIYWLMATVLPGFRQFRYPAKLFTLTSLGLAALAGMGWDTIGRGGTRRLTAVSATLVGITLILLAGVVAARRPILTAFSAATGGSLFGPFDPDAAYFALVRGLVQGAIVLSLTLMIVRLAARRPRLAGLLALLVTTADLAVANRHFVLTVPQSTFETKPEVFRVIEEAERKEAERKNPAPGPFRIHRLPSWDPMHWLQTRSPDRSREIVEWERDTLQPKHGISLGVEFAHVVGVAELYEVEWYWGGFLRTVRDPTVARMLNVELGSKVAYFPRRAFDMWNARYFVAPLWSNGWKDAFRGFASMLLDSDRIYPPKDSFQGPDREEAMQKWTETRDIQVFRNRRAHPRAWVVHSIRRLPPLEGLRADADRQVAMQEITYEDDPFWSDPTRHAFDPHQVAWVEGDPPPDAWKSGLFSLIRSMLGWRDTGQFAKLQAFLSRAPTRPSETVKVSYPSSQRVDLDVHLETPGLVVLADVYYPGWKLTIDNVPAPIYQVNRAMRGAAVSSGPHHLVYTYSPSSFRIGLIASAMGLVTMLAFAVACYRWPVEPAIGCETGAETSEILGDD